MKTYLRFFPINTFTIVTIAACVVSTLGCNQQPDTTSEPITSNLDHNHDHDHKHVHGPGADHEHEHEDGHQGAHSHLHTHGHRHGKPIHGGKIVSLGHTHHEKGSTNYHAEILPANEDQISFHVLVEDEEGKLKDFSADDEKVAGFVNVKKGNSLGAVEIEFERDKEDQSKFASAIPERFIKAEDLTVVIPKIQIGSQKLDFSFKVAREIAEEKKEETKTESVKEKDSK